MKRFILVILGALLLLSCASAGEKVVKPRTHKMWARGNRYVIDIPVGTRHIRMFERKRTKIVRMK
jgi:PBP1b-binding outer membrane lipoprotein LpoB